MSDTVCRGAGKVNPHHLGLEACIYIRKALLRKVPEDTGGGCGQHSLRRQAIALGWPEERVRVIDGDQGKSGVGSAGRRGFRELVASVAAGEVGIVLSRQISCLNRSVADLQRLLHVAALTGTLILDEAGIHDPNDSSDRLLLGIKGSMFEFELQGIRQRLPGSRPGNARRRGSGEVGRSRQQDPGALRSAGRVRPANKRSGT